MSTVLDPFISLVLFQLGVGVVAVSFVVGLHLIVMRGTR